MSDHSLQNKGFINSFSSEKKDNPASVWPSEKKDNPNVTCIVGNLKKLTSQLVIGNIT